MESRLSKGLQLSRARRPMSARCVLQFALAHLCVQKRGSVPASPARRSARERALRTLAPAALWRPAALGHLSASLQPRPARAPQPVLRVRPAAAIPVTPTASLCAPLWRQSSAPSRYLCALGAFSLHVAVARAYRLRAAVASRQPLSATPTLWVWVRAGMSWGARQHALLRPHGAPPAAAERRPGALLQLLLRRRRSRGARGRTRIDATAHRGRLLGRSASLAASTARGTSNAPRHALLQPHGAPPAARARPAAARRHMAVSSMPRPRRPRRLSTVALTQNENVYCV